MAIIAHNYGAFLEECIESVLNQTIPATEIIVVDDASTDNTAESAASFAADGVKYLRVDFRMLHVPLPFFIAMTVDDAVT